MLAREAVRSGAAERLQLVWGTEAQRAKQQEMGRRQAWEVGRVGERERAVLGRGSVGQVRASETARERLGETG